MNEETFSNWEDPTPDYDVWEQNEVARDLAAEHQAEAEALERKCIQGDLDDDLVNIRHTLERAFHHLYESPNQVRAYEMVKAALEYLRHVEENVRRLS